MAQGQSRVGALMELIKNFNLTSFTQISWVSQEAKDKWAKVIPACSQMVQDLEILSVKHGHRPCAWRTISRQSLPDFSKQCAEMGLIVLPVCWVGSWEGFIHHTPEGDTNVYCIIAREMEHALEYLDAFNRGDNAKQGELLGFPKCCCEFFAKHWDAGYFDPIWQMAGRDNPSPYSNPMLRYIGLRVGFHIPCSFHCDATIAMAKDRLGIAPDQDLVKLLVALLSMPMSWSALHGQAVIRTPIFYLITQTVPTLKEYIVELPGSFVPLETANGLRFPFRRPA
jgi:hypothetical protein